MSFETLLDLDPNSEFSKHVIAEKRAKCKAAYMQQLALYRQENDENQITRLENMFHEYENDRLRKEQQYRMFNPWLSPCVQKQSCSPTT